MGIFDKKFSFWLVAFLLILNLGSLGALWFGKTDSRPPGPPPMHPKHDKVTEFLSKELGLDEEQKAELSELRREFRSSTRLVIENQNRNKRLMFEALTQVDADTATAEIYANDIGIQQTKLEKAMLNHYLAIRGICSSKEQEEKLGKVFHRAIRPGPGPRHGPGGKRPPPSRKQ
ncbi:MAG: periplasmic heavy metal sensor [Bacteroidota bacterium]